MSLRLYNSLTLTRKEEMVTMSSSFQGTTNLFYHFSFFYYLFFSTSTDHQGLLYTVNAKKKYSLGFFIQNDHLQVPSCKTARLASPCINHQEID